jgi:hypothetical protein
VVAASASKGGSSSEESGGSKALMTAVCWFLRRGSRTSGLYTKRTGGRAASKCKLWFSPVDLWVVGL